MRKTESQKLRSAVCLMRIGAACGQRIADRHLRRAHAGQLSARSVLEDYGKKYALLLYAVVSLLSLFWCRIKKLVLFMFWRAGGITCAAGAAEQHPPRCAAVDGQDSCFNAAVAVMYALLIWCWPAELVQEFAAEGTPMLLALLALGNLSFWRCDRALRPSPLPPAHCPRLKRSSDAKAKR